MGLAVLVLGMAFSGPYKQEYDLLFRNGKGVQQAGAYRVELLEGEVVWRAPPGASFPDASQEPDASAMLRLLVNMIGPFAPDEML